MLSGDQSPSGPPSGSPTFGSPRGLIRHQYAKMEVEEGDDRGTIYFDESEERRLMAGRFSAEWLSLEEVQLRRGSVSSRPSDRLDCFEAVTREMILKEEHAEWAVFAKVAKYEQRELSEHHVDHNYTNFLFFPDPLLRRSTAAKHNDGSAGSTNVAKSETALLTSTSKSNVRRPSGKEQLENGSPRDPHTHQQHQMFNDVKASYSNFLFYPDPTFQVKRPLRNAPPSAAAAVAAVSEGHRTGDDVPVVLKAVAPTHPAAPLPEHVVPAPTDNCVGQEETQSTSNATSSASTAAPLPARNASETHGARIFSLLVAQMEMICELEHIVRQGNYQEEAEGFHRLLKHVRSVASLQVFKESLPFVLQDEEQDRLVLYGMESCEWSILVEDSAEDCVVCDAATEARLVAEAEMQTLREAEMASAAATKCAAVQHNPLDAEEQQQGSSASSDRNETVTSPPLYPDHITESIQTSYTINTSQMTFLHQSSAEADRAGEAETESPQTGGLRTPPCSPAAGNRVVTDDISLLELFEEECAARNQNEADELEMRDIISIEMELDRDEANAAAHRRASHHQPSGPSYESPVRPVKLTDDPTPRHGATHHDDFHHRRFSITNVQHLWFEALPFADAIKVAAAEQYERQELAKRYGASMRLFESARKDPQALGKLLIVGWEHQVILSPQPPSRPKVAQQSVRQSPVLKIAYDHHNHSSHDDHFEVPDAARLKDNSPPQRQPPSEGDDDANYALMLKEKGKLRSLSIQMKDTDNEEVVEREVLEAIALEELRNIVDFFASQVVEEYDWGLAGYRMKLRARQGTDGAASLGTIAADPRNESSCSTTAGGPPSRCDKDRHLPAHLRKSVAPRKAPPEGRLQTVPQSLSRQSGVSPSLPQGSRLAMLRPSPPPSTTRSLSHMATPQPL